MKRLHAHWVWLYAPIAILVATSSGKIWERIYFSLNTPQFIGGLLILICALYALAIWGVDRIFGLTGRGATSRVVFLVCLAVFVLKLRTSTLTPVFLVTGITGFLASLLVVFGVFWALRAKHESLTTCCRIVSFGSVAYLFSGLLLSLSLAPKVELLGRDPTDKVPTVWLLLDEASYVVGASIAEKLSAQGFYVDLQRLATIGENTLDIVPGIFLQSPFGREAAPCGMYSVCSKSKVFDFQRVAFPGDTDVVGSYHPYCAAGGYRSCFQVAPSELTFQGQKQALLCAVSKKFGASTGECRERNATSFDRNSREKTISAVWAAPFWTQGGQMYVHLLLPHLPGPLNRDSSLQEAYAANTEASAILSVQLAKKMQEVFPRGFRIVIFSDHPLRTKLACASNFSGKCHVPANWAPEFGIPLIVASSHELNVRRMPDNASVLDALR